MFAEERPEARTHSAALSTQDRLQHLEVCEIYLLEAMPFWMSLALLSTALGLRQGDEAVDMDVEPKQYFGCYRCKQNEGTKKDPQWVMRGSVVTIRHGYFDVNPSAVYLYPHTEVYHLPHGPTSPRQDVTDTYKTGLGSALSGSGVTKICKTVCEKELQCDSFQLSSCWEEVFTDTNSSSS